MPRLFIRINSHASPPDAQQTLVIMLSHPTESHSELMQSSVQQGPLKTNQTKITPTLAGSSTRTARWLVVCFHSLVALISFPCLALID